MIAAGFSYQVVVAHNGCLQMEVTVHGDMAHAAIPDSGTDALQGAVHILNALYRLNGDYLQVCSNVEGITHPYLNVGLIQGGTNTNVIPGKVVLKLDRRMIPKKTRPRWKRRCAAPSNRPPPASARPAAARGWAWTSAASCWRGPWCRWPATHPLVHAIQTHGEAVFGEPIPAVGTPLYTDVRLYVECGIPGVIYGAGPRTVRESNAKRADENLLLDDLRRATKVVARTLRDLLA
jgi:succinyl-diaminopimelate desuccinylase